MRIFRLLALGQVIFFLSITACTILIPHFLETEGGISNFGLYAKTIPFFTLGFVASGVTAIWSGNIVHKNQALKQNLRILGILFLLALVSTYPYKLNGTWDAIHQGVSQLLFVFQAGFGAWLAFRYCPEFWAKTLFTVQLASSVIALETVLGTIHLLFVSQILTGLAFGALLLRATRRTV